MLKTMWKFELSVHSYFELSVHAYHIRVLVDLLKFVQVYFSNLNCQYMPIFALGSSTVAANLILSVDNGTTQQHPSPGAEEGRRLGAKSRDHTNLYSTYIFCNNNCYCLYNAKDERVCQEHQGVGGHGRPRVRLSASA
jgi:hypothetical protein